MGKQNYLVQPQYTLDRNADYETQEYINSVFETVSEIPDSGTSGNLGSDIHVNKKKKKAFICEKPSLFSDKDNYEKFEAENASLYQAISSALALYRLICIFPHPKFVELSGGDGYKMPWEIMLRHKETGEYVGFGEWKGGFNVRGTKNALQYKEKTLDDFMKLLNLILSNKAPHPYDRTVAGSVA